MSRKATCLVLAAAAALFFLAGCSADKSVSKATNHVVIMVDASGSYKDRQAEAVDRASAILGQLAKTSLNRWEEDRDRIFIVSLDASPDTLWEGSLKDLKSKGASFWRERFESRTDYSRCTDVSSAFRIAAQHLEGDSRYISKYLFVFSDMLHEPPTSSITKCQEPVAVSPEDFPWEALGDVSVSIFWMPPNQKFFWRKAIENHQLSSHFALYTDSESASAPIPEPPRPKAKLSEGERKIQQEKALGLIGTFGKWFMTFVGTMILLVAGICLVVWIVKTLQRSRGGQLAGQGQSMQNRRVVYRQNQGQRSGPRPLAPPRDRKPQ